MSKLASAAALDIIGLGGLGYEFDALGSESVFARAVKQFLYVTTSPYLFSGSNRIQPDRRRNSTDYTIVQTTVVLGSLVISFLVYGYCLSLPGPLRPFRYEISGNSTDDGRYGS